MPTPPPAAWIRTRSPARSAAVVDQPRVRGGVRDRQGRRLGVAPAVGDRDQRVAARHGELGVAAEARPAHDALADLEALDPLADGVDVAGDLVADNAGRLGGVRVEPDAREQVREVDPGGAHAHAHLARAGLRIGTLLHPHDVGRAVLGDDEGAHTRIIPTRARSASSAPAGRRADLAARRRAGLPVRRRGALLTGRPGAGVPVCRRPVRRVRPRPHRRQALQPRCPARRSWLARRSPPAGCRSCPRVRRRAARGEERVPARRAAGTRAIRPRARRCEGL